MQETMDKSFAQEVKLEVMFLRVTPWESEDFISYTFKTNKLPILNKEHLEDSIRKLRKNF